MTMVPIKVIAHGALGKMGREVVNAVSKDPEMRLVGAVDINAKDNFLMLPDGSGKVPLSTDLDSMLVAQKPDVVVDFSLVKAAIPAMLTCVNYKVAVVSGTTGMGKQDLDEIDRKARAQGVGVVWASNFALGAVLMIHLSSIAAKYFDYAEITELHHHLKADAPSGTSLTTARAMAKARGKAFRVPSENDSMMKSRGEQVEGVAIHSVRLPGLMAHQEVIFGIAGQTLTIRHDTINRECYMPGVLLAVKAVRNYKGLVSGLASLLKLE
jgi:4-hydroxy-tetrahydrodipicolinate reductase